MNDNIPVHTFSRPKAIAFIDRICIENNHMFYPAHRHEFYELVFFSKGNGTHSIDFNDYPVRKDMVYFLSPGQIHEMRWEGREGYVISFSEELFHQIQSVENISFNTLFYPMDNNPSICIDSGNVSSFNYLFILLEKEVAKKNININLIRNYIAAILINCLEYSKELKHNKVNDRIKTLRLEINKSFKTERYGDYYARRLCISLKHLNDITRASIGKTVTQLIHERIILEAKREVAYTDKAINEIAYDLGFKDPAYFNRFFKRFLNITPEEFRKISK